MWKSFRPFAIRAAIRGVMTWTVLATLALVIGFDYVEYLFFESIPFLISLGAGWIISFAWVITR